MTPEIGRLPRFIGLEALRELFNVELLRRDVKLRLCSQREPKPKATPKEPEEVEL